MYSTRAVPQPTVNRQYINLQYTISTSICSTRAVQGPYRAAQGQYKGRTRAVQGQYTGSTQAVQGPYLDDTQTLDAGDDATLERSSRPPPALARATAVTMSCRTA